MKNKLWFLIPFVSIAMFLSSCKKKGCTDPNAVNHCSKCKEDQSCQYQGRVVVWWEQSTSQTWTLMGVSAVDIYIDGTFVDSRAATTYFSAAPECGSNNSINYIKEMGTAKSANGTIEIRRATLGTVLNSGTFTYVGGACLRVKIN